ncbi:MAG: DUF3047 domain-containing protein [Deltaproteobacteria bacterium]|jgi:hypothetical protein|nr:DUF3047 domain-containing protein [Deltaproteobacteria bacterium]
MKKILLTIILFFLFPHLSHADGFRIPPECEIIIDDFKNGIKPGWKPKSFKAITEYTWVKDNSRSYIRATSSNAASGLIYEIEYDPEMYPYIIWNWKVDNTLANGDARKKSGDDYGARIYVIFPSYLFWNTKAINYIWANKLPRNSAVPNPYTSNDIMVSVQSGPLNTDKWLSETRNVYEDYIRFFNKKPSKVGAIAIMTDTDNTGESTSAGYGPIAVCSKDPGK